MFNPAPFAGEEKDEVLGGAVSALAFFYAGHRDAGGSFDRTLHRAIREAERLAGLVLDAGYPKFDRGPGVPSEKYWADWEPTTLDDDLD